MLECVRLNRLPGDHRALVDEETAALGEAMGELRRLDADPDPGREPMREPKTPRR